jgi:hypothetical protein
VSLSELSNDTTRVSDDGGGGAIVFLRHVSFLEKEKRMHQGERPQPPPQGLPHWCRLGGTSTAATRGRHGGVGFSVRPDRSRSGGFEVATPGPDPAMTSSSSSQTGLRPSPCWRRRLGSSLKSKMRHDRQWLGC